MKAKDLAKKLGVSPATISLVLNNKPGVSDSLRHSLIEKIQEMGCDNMLCVPTVDLAGKNEEAANSSRPVVAYLIYTSCDEHNDRFAFYPAVLEGAEMEARDHNYNLVVFHMNCEGNSSLPDLIQRTGNVIGAIVQTVHITENIINDIKVLDIPCVFVDCYRPDKRVSCVCVNNEQGIFSAVKYLKSRGHRNLGYVSRGGDKTWQKERRQFFHQALVEYGLQDHPENYFVAGIDEDFYNFQSLAKVFSQAPCLPSAFIAENDRQAWRTVQALKSIGRKVPEEISVIGFDDRSLCTMVEPNLTSIKNYRHLMGRECILMLQNLKRLKRLGVKNPCLKYELPTELIERDSVADYTGSY